MRRGNLEPSERESRVTSLLLAVDRNSAPGGGGRVAANFRILDPSYYVRKAGRRRLNKVQRGARVGALYCTPRWS